MSKALLLIDIQNAIFELPVPLHEPERFLTSIEMLLSKARANNIPVVFIQHCTEPGTRFEKGSKGWEIHPNMQPRAGEIIIEKINPDAFQNTQLEQALKRLGVNELCVGGFASQYCLDTTVRSAFAKGYKVILASDAHSTTSDSILKAEQIVEHENLVLQRFAKVCPSQEILFDR